MMGEWLKYWPIVLFGLNGLAVWVSWSVRKGVATQEDLKKHAETTGALIKEVEDRITHLEAQIAHGPSEDDLIRLHARLDTLTAEVSKLVGEFSGTRRTLEMLQQFLLEEGSRK